MQVMSFVNWAAAALLAHAVGCFQNAVGQSDLKPLRVGSASVELEADDGMVIAGGITAGKAQGQEAPLRVVAIVMEQDPFGKLAIVSCDVLMLTKDLLEPVFGEIEREPGLARDRLLIHCTHTHHAPSTVLVHGYGAEESFCRTLQEGIVGAVRSANANLTAEPCTLYFAQGEENTVGENSRLRLADGQIYWVGPRTNVVRPTGPFDAELPVLAFRSQPDQLRALIFNHSTHNIGTRQPGKRSPGFYGLAAQDLESELGGKVCFLAGAFGSTHNLTLSGETLAQRIKQAVKETMAMSKPFPTHQLAALRQPFTFKVRQFDEAEEDAAVTRYCRQYVPSHADPIIEVFRSMRRQLAPLQGQTKTTWLQVMLIGDIAFVGVPSELFTQLGIDIKNRSPFRYTYVVGLANDWIGYVPDMTAFKLGGYQVWTGYHSYVEPGTGERLIDQTIEMLRQLAARPSKPEVH